MKKDNAMKKSRKINAEKKAARKPRLTKEEREARKLKLQEERAAKKAARLAKREAKKQKEAERKAAAKAKREERKAKKAARLQAEKERKAARAKKVREPGIKIIAIDGKSVGKKAKNAEVKKVSVQEKIEAERNEWKALSAIRRYVKDNAKILAELEGEKLARRLKKLEKMGYTVDTENGTPISIGYSFEIGVKTKAAKPAAEKPERKSRKPRAEKMEEEVQQPQDSAVAAEPEELPAEAEEKLLTDDEILEAAKQDAEAQSVEVLAGDTFKDETEIADDDSLKNPEDADEELDEDDDNDDEDDDILGRGSDISDEQADYRHEAFREMEANGTWD